MDKKEYWLIKNGFDYYFGDSFHGPGSKGWAVKSLAYKFPTKETAKKVIKAIRTNNPENYYKLVHVKSQKTKLPTYYINIHKNTAYLYMCEELAKIHAVSLAEHVAVPYVPETLHKELLKQKLHECMKLIEEMLKHSHEIDNSNFVINQIGKMILDMFDNK